MSTSFNISGHSLCVVFLFSLLQSNRESLSLYLQPNHGSHPISPSLSTPPEVHPEKRSNMNWDHTMIKHTDNRPEMGRWALTAGLYVKWTLARICSPSKFSYKTSTDLECSSQYFHASKILHSLSEGSSPRGGTAYC